MQEKMHGVIKFYYIPSRKFPRMCRPENEWNLLEKRTPDRIIKDVVIDKNNNSIYSNIDNKYLIEDEETFGVYNKDNSIGIEEETFLLKVFEKN